MKIQFISLLFAFASTSPILGSTLKKNGSSFSDHAAGSLELNLLDKRTPVPLSPIMALHQKEDMRMHLEVIQAIVEGLAQEDFGAIEKAAKRIAFDETQEKKCTHMGAGAPGFAELAINFHKTADSIVEASRLKDKVATLRALNKTLKTCTTCHSLYRQEVVAESASQNHRHHTP